MNRDHRIRTPGSIDSEGQRRGRVVYRLAGAGEVPGAVAPYHGSHGGEATDDRASGYINRSWLPG